MSRTAPASAVGYDELAALKEVALAGGVDGPAKVSCSTLADRLDVSSQTASRRLQRLEAADLVERDVVADGQWVETTTDGEATLRGEYADYRQIFASDRSLDLVGTVTSGMGEGRHYISLSGYMEQFTERLGYEPFPGTLNVELEEASVRVRPEMASMEAVPIDGWEDEERTFGPATCYPAAVESGGDRADTAHVIVPERTHHDETQLEVIAPVKLRDALGLDDGDEVSIRVEEA
jgi:riboflavin kinase